MNKNQHPWYTMCANFDPKWTTLNFSAEICPKKDLGLETEKSKKNRKENQLRRDTLYANFHSNWTTLSFLVQISSKMDLGFEIQKTNVGASISNLEIKCVLIFRQNEQLWLFWSKFAQKWI